MTFATGSPDARALLAERFGEDLVPLAEPVQELDSGARTRFIAALHALIEFFTIYDVPVPELISLIASTDEHGLVAFAETYQREIYGLKPQADMNLLEPLTGRPDVRINLIVRQALDSDGRPL